MIHKSETRMVSLDGPSQCTIFKTQHVSPRFEITNHQPMSTIIYTPFHPQDLKVKGLEISLSRWRFLIYINSTYVTSMPYWPNNIQKLNWIGSFFDDHRGCSNASVDESIFCYTLVKKQYAKKNRSWFWLRLFWAQRWFTHFFNKDIENILILVPVITQFGHRTSAVINKFINLRLSLVSI